jgi:type II secretory pathway component PulK
MMKRRRGFFLIVVLVVIAVSTFAVYSFSEWMLVMDDAAHLQSENEQASACVDSAGAMLRVVLSQSEADRNAQGGLYNNPQLFQAVPVATVESGSGDFNFSIIAPGINAEGQIAGIRFGVQDESERLNVNALPIMEANSSGLTDSMNMMLGEDQVEDPENIAVSLLMSLPGMTEDVADAILDWIDEDDEPRPFGAESETYSVLTSPYSCANGSITSIDELLLVRGVTPLLLFGADANRNGVLDADEQQRQGITIDSPGALGWSALLTAHGSESNLRPDGTPRINVNQDDLEVLYDELLDGLGVEAYASYIVAYRMYGNPPVSPTTALDPETIAEAVNDSSGSAKDGGLWDVAIMEDLDLTAGAKNTLTQILDLVDTSVTIGDGEDAVEYQSPFLGDPVSMSAYMTLLMDTLTTSDFEALPGRLNINSCSIDLLRGIPMLDDETIMAIVENRDPASLEPDRRYATWLLTEGIVTVDQMRLLTPIICGQGSVFRAQTIGYNAAGGAFVRSEIILDAHTINPKIISFRNLSHLGRGFDLSVLGQRGEASY